MALNHPKPDHRQAGRATGAADLVTLTGLAKERADPAMDAIGERWGGGGEHEARESDRGRERGGRWVGATAWAERGFYTTRPRWRRRHHR